MFKLALAFCAGAALLHALPALVPPVALIAPALAAVLLARRRPAAAAFLAGFLWTHFVAAHRISGAWPCDRDREEIALTGRVAVPAFERGGRVDIELEELRSSSAGPLPRRARIAWYDALDTPRPGEHWRMTVRLRCRHGMANPGAADRELDLVRQRIDATGYVAGKTRPQRLAHSVERPVERLRSRIAASITQAVPAGPSVAVLQGLSVGVRGSIPDALWETFAVTGVAHLMAISGMHVTGCALFILALLRGAWRTPLCARMRGRIPAEACIVVAATAAYTALAGASVPALRTLATVMLAAALRLMRRALPLHLLLALVALVLVATDPLALVSAGFWLSMLATAALFTVLDSAPGWRGRVHAFARAQAAVTALLTPVLATSFGRVSLVAPAANAIAIPFFGAVLLPAVLSATLLEAAWPGAVPGLWRALALLLDRVWPGLDALAAWPASSWSPAAPSAPLVAGAGLAALASLLVPMRGLRLAAIAILAALVMGDARRPEPGAFALTVIDVGQGLAAVVETSRHVLVFDTGASWQGGGSAARVTLVPYLRARGIRRIDRLVVSHRDMDHAGGVPALGRSFRIARTMTPPEAVRPGDEPCLRDREWRWDGVEFRVLHPPPGFDGDVNDGSCALAISGPGGRALLLADPEEAAESAMLARPLAADVVVLPHHGSRTSSGEALVAAVGARLGIASAGFNNRWGMPAREVVARWRGAGTAVLGTAEWGAVTVHSPARRGAPTIVTERGANPRWWRERGPRGRSPPGGSASGRTVSCRAMWEIILAGGPVMWPIILCSVVAAAIVLERLWTLQRKRVIPRELTERAWKLVESRGLNERHIDALAHSSPLGRVLAAGLANREQGRDIMKEAIEDTGRHVVHELERFLGTLGTIAAITPLLGLLGTVMGMIQAFEAIAAEGVGDPKVLSGGIGAALITTAAGLIVAIPALFAYRYLRGLVDLLVIDMEKEAMKLVQAFDRLTARAQPASVRREAAS